MLSNRAASNERVALSESVVLFGKRKRVSPESASVGVLCIRDWTGYRSGVALRLFFAT